MLRNVLPSHALEYLDAQIEKSVLERFEIPIKSPDLKLQGASELATRIASESAENRDRNRN